MICPHCGKETRPTPEHGSDRRYALGCRCDVCKAAKAKWMRRYRARWKELDNYRNPKRSAKARAGTGE